VGCHFVETLGVRAQSANAGMDGQKEKAGDGRRVRETSWRLGRREILHADGATVPSKHQSVVGSEAHIVLYALADVLHSMTPSGFAQPQPSAGSVSLTMPNSTN
jgi:hypothetical protein